MKKSLALASILAAVMSFAQDVAPATAPAEKAAPHKSLTEAVGGFVIQPLTPDAKYITVVDTRKAKDEGADKFVAKVSTLMHLATRIGEPTQGDVVIRLVDEGDSVVYLDKAEATVVAGDNAEATASKLMAALIRIIGIKEDKFGPQVMNTAMSQAKAMGIGLVRRTTYKKACEEGWAPPPADEFQKAVAEKVAAKKAAAAVTNAPAATPPSAAPVK